MFQAQSQAAQPPIMAQFQTMASATASHLVPQQSQQQRLQQHDESLAKAAAHDRGAMATNSSQMALAANTIVAGGQPSVVRRVVKWVFSGDYLVLREHPRGGPPPEYYVNLAYVQAPRFNRSPGEDGKTSVSEPWAWEAKEYLAKRFVGKEVFYQSEYTKSGGAQAGAGSGGAFGGNANKEFGIIYYYDENIVETMVSMGFLDVRRTKAESPILQHLIEVEEAAKAAGKGRWSSQPAPKHELLHEHPNPSSLKGKVFTGTVENVRNGGAMQVYLDLGIENGVHKHLNASIMISGIRTPDKNRANEAKFFDEAKYFTESRFLNREVNVFIEKVERNSFLATVSLGEHNLAEALLRQGMARCNDSSISLVKDPLVLRRAEREGKLKGQRLWENYVDNRGEGPAESFEAKVVEVISGDSMMVENLGTGELKKIFLASIRLGTPVDRERQREAAKPQEESSEATNNKSTGRGEGRQTKSSAAADAPKPSSIPRIYDNPILYHARELLRKKLLGKKALVKVEYVQPKSDSYPEKICCTVRPADQPKWNAAEALVSKGYASVIKYMSDDSQRASNFDELLKAEQNALKSKDSKDKEKMKDFAPLKVVDLCNDATRAKQLYPFLSRTRKDAIVEFVFSASRFKMFLAKENNTLLNLVLAGVIVPREPEALKNASTLAAKALVHQRDVSIQVDSMDKKGNFIGWIFYKDELANRETSLNLQLVKLGYGQVRDSSASGTLGELKAAENVAREKKLGLWLNYQEPKRREENSDVGVGQENNDAAEEEASATTNGVGSAKAAANKEAELLKNRKPVIVTNAQMKEKSVIVSVQHVESGPKLEELLKQMRSELPQAGKKGGSGEGYTPSNRGEIVAAKFSDDNQWYRAKVLRVNSPQDIEILFIDYGNLDKVKSKDLAKLSPKYTSQEAFAKDYTLAFVEATTHDQDWVEESRRAFFELSTPGQVLMKVEYKDPVTNQDAISLVDESTKSDIGKKLVENGLLIALKRRERKLIKTINEYINAEKTAKENRANMWRYGDFTADDAREFGLA